MHWMQWITWWNLFSAFAIAHIYAHCDTRFPFLLILVMWKDAENQFWASLPIGTKEGDKSVRFVWNLSECALPTQIYNLYIPRFTGWYFFMPLKFANKHAFSRVHGRGEKHLSKPLLKKTKLKSPSNELLCSRDRGQPTFPLNISQKMRLDFAMVSAGQFQLAPFFVYTYIFKIPYIQFRLQHSYWFDVWGQPGRHYDPQTKRIHCRFHWIWKRSNSKQIYFRNICRTSGLNVKDEDCFCWFVAHQFCNEKQNLIQSI
jgi:hypothetical protein